MTEPVAIPTSGPDVYEGLSRRLAGSDRAAFEDVFRRMRGDLVRYAGRIVRDDALAHDLVQDVFFDLWMARDRLDPGQSLRAYLFRSTRNRAFNHLRDRRRHSASHAEIRAASDSTANARVGPEEELEADMLGAWLDARIRELPDRQAEALRLSRYGGLSHEEIAEVMEISPRTVNNHIVRALAFLSERLRSFRAPTQP